MQLRVLEDDVVLLLHSAVGAPGNVCDEAGPPAIPRKMAHAKNRIATRIIQFTVNVMKMDMRFAVPPAVAECVSM